jgi:hypothetical protein
MKCCCVLLNLLNPYFILYIQVKEAFDFPCGSARVGYFIAEGISDDTEQHPVVTGVKTKCIGLHLDNVIDHPSLLKGTCTKAAVNYDSDEDEDGYSDDEFFDDLDDSPDDHDVPYHPPSASPLTHAGRWFITLMGHSK